MDAPDGDERLMCRYRDGDADAFETLYARHRGGLYRFILRQVTVAALADELFQEVWMSVIDSRSRYEPSARFTTWLYRMARNRVIDHYRRQSVRLAAHDDGDTDPDALAGDAADEPDRRAAADDAMAHLLDAVAALPENQRTAFLLRHEAGMTAAAIGDVTGVSEETAKSRLRYATRRLRDALDEHHE